MFGCSYLLRNWSPEEARGNHGPSHVNSFTAEEVKNKAGLDQKGIILVALMSGADYDANGLAGCGFKTACEAARAGFGEELIAATETSTEDLELWRQKLQNELRTNENSTFRQKHKAITIPNTFPNPLILNFYQHPIISGRDTHAQIRLKLEEKTPIDVHAIQEFVADAFGWTDSKGTKQLIRALAPVVLVQKLLCRGRTLAERSESNTKIAEAEETRLIKEVFGRRSHWRNGDCPELRVNYIPAEITGISINREAESDNARGSDKENVAFPRTQVDSLDVSSQPSSPSKARLRDYDPTLPQRIWVLETFLKLGTPLLVENWEENTRVRGFLTTQKRHPYHPQHGAMDKYVKTTKFSSYQRIAEDAISSNVIKSTKLQSPKKAESAPMLRKQPKQPVLKQPLNNKVNPWTLAKRPSDTFGYVSQSRYSALGIYAPGDPENDEPRPGRGPSSALQAEAASRKHSRNSSSTSDSSLEVSSQLCPTQSTSFLSQDLSNVTLRTPRREKPIRGSPRKRIDASGGARSFKSNTLFIQKSSNTEGITQGISGETKSKQKPSEKPNRTIDFVKEVNLGEAFGSDRAVRSRVNLADSPSRGNLQSLLDADRLDQSKKAIALRDSLDGAWKYLGGEEAYTCKHIFENVESLDMTGA